MLTLPNIFLGIIFLFLVDRASSSVLRFLVGPDAKAGSVNGETLPGVGADLFCESNPTIEFRSVDKGVIGDLFFGGVRKLIILFMREGDFK